MRRLLPLLIAYVSVAGCGDPNAGALFADIQYGTGCRITGGCEPQPSRDICGVHLGDPCAEVGGQATLSCSIIEATDESTRTVTFSASQGRGFSISVRQAVIPFDGGSAGGGSCNVTFADGPNTYTGACGSGTPTAEQPCQISSVRFYDDLGSPTIEGSIFCDALPNQTNPALHLEVHAKGSGTMEAMSPGSFRLANCNGLNVPEGG